MVWGSGSDIWNNADQFNFASESVSGNQTIVAEVTGLANTDPWAKAGVMFRDSDDPGAVAVDVLATEANGVTFQWRDSTGGSSNSATVAGVAAPTLSAPVWVKLVQSGSTFSGYYSTDGGTWIQIGTSRTISFNDSSYLAGLAVTSHNNGALNTATFTDVSIFGDPGFETPEVGTGPSAYAYDPTDSPWTFSGDAGVAGNGSAFTAVNPDAPEGRQVAFLQDFGGVSQTLLFAAGTYSVSFSAAQRGNGNASSQTFQVLIDANVVGTFTPADSNYTGFTTGTFNVTTGAHTVSFAGTDPDGLDNTAFIDQVSVNLVASLRDPGFETPAVGTGAYQYDPSGSPWTFSGSAGVSGNGSAFTAGNPNAPEGNQVAFLQSYGGLSQTLTFAAGSYSLSFDAAQRAGNASSQTFAVLIDGAAVGVFTPGDVNYATFTTSSFTLTAGSHTVALVGLDPDGLENTVFIDQVAVNQTAG
jgi:hypothetical protein